MRPKRELRRGKILDKKTKLKDIKYISAWDVFFIKYLKSFGGLFEKFVICYDEENIKEMIAMNGIRRLEEEKFIR